MHSLVDQHVKSTVEGSSTLVNWWMILCKVHNALMLTFQAETVSSTLVLEDDGV